MAAEEIDEKVVEILDRLAMDLDMDRSVLLERKMADLNLDSMDMVTLIFDIEEALDIEIDINDLDTRMSLAEVINASTATESVI